MPLLEHTDNGILFESYLTGPNGAGFILYPEEHHTRKDINDAKHEIRYNFDVVCLRIANHQDRFELFRSYVFSDPRTRPLKWYQIKFEFIDWKNFIKGTDWEQNPKEAANEFVSLNLAAWQANPVLEKDPLYINQ